MADPKAVAPIWARWFQVLVAPGRLFVALRERPLWLTAMLLGAALAAASTGLIPAEIWNEMIRRQLLESGAAIPEQLALGGTTLRISTAIAAAVSWVVWSFVVAGFVTVTFGMILGDDGRYRQYLAVTTHALLIAALGGILTVPLRILREDPRVTLNLGLFLPLEPGYLLNFFTMLDLFLLWTYVTIAIGAHEIDRRRSLGSATVVMLGFAVVMAGLVAFVPR
jgi:hypothetical protein